MPVLLKLIAAYAYHGLFCRHCGSCVKTLCGAVSESFFKPIIFVRAKIDIISSKIMRRSPPMVNVKPVQLGKTTRMSFGKINEALEMPNLIEVQKNSYKWFLEEGLKEVFRDVAAITDYNGNLVLNFVDYHLDETPKYSVAECKERDVSLRRLVRQIMR